MPELEARTEAQPEPEVSLREQLIAARDESQERQAKELEPVKEPETPPGHEERRAASDATRPQGISDEQKTEPKEPKAPVSYPAPRSWSDQEKPLWAKVPPEVQAVINRREADFHRKVAEQDEVRSAGSQFMAVANKYAPAIKARGTTPAAYFEQLLGIVSQIDSARTPQERAQVFDQIARQQGVDLRQALGLSNGSSPNPQVPLQTLVEQTVQQRLEAWQVRQTEAKEQEVMQQTTSEIEAFRSKVNEQGLPAYPYFDHVVNLMAGLVQSGAATTLEEAYNFAVRAHPETSKLLAEAEKAEAAAKEARRLKAEAAKRKGGSVRGGPGTNAPASGERTLRDELRSAFDEARARV